MEDLNHLKAELSWYIISTCIQEPGAFYSLQAIVSAEDLGPLEPLWVLLEEMVNEGQPIGYLSYAMAIKEKMANLFLSFEENQAHHCVPSLALHYAKKLRQINCNERIKNLAIESNGLDAGLPDAILEAVIPAKRDYEIKINTINQAMTEAYHRLEKSTGGLMGISTGLSGVDDILGGLQSGLYVVAGRPSMGKSALSLGFALSAAQAGKKVLYLSAEEEPWAIANRIQSRLTGQSVETLSKCQHVKWEQLAANLNVEWGANMVIASVSGASIEKITTFVRQRYAQEPFNMIVFDHLQCVRSSKLYSSRHLEIGYITQVFKNLSSDFSVPCVLVSQLSRAVENRADKFPEMSDLKESGDIEQIADVIMLLYREHYYKPESDPRQASLIIAKNRHGRVGGIDLNWDGPKTQFLDYTERLVLDFTGGRADLN